MGKKKAKSKSKSKSKKSKKTEAKKTHQEMLGDSKLRQMLKEKIEKDSEFSKHVKEKMGSMFTDDTFWKMHIDWDKIAQRLKKDKKKK